MHCPACASPLDGTRRQCPRCGKLVFTLAGGTLFDERYAIERGLGRGGMGEVYKALDRELEEWVAIKLLRPELTDSAAATRRFRAEARLARRVRHKNVCAIHDFGRCGEICYLTMEYVEGIDLHAILRSRGRLTAAEALDATLQTAAALEAIHELGIVHRDLKTANLMRDQQGLIRVMDFGIAKRSGEEHGASLTGTGMIVGTPEYMSPEQLRAEPVDARSDLYSLGVVLFELLTGEVPFRATTPLATALKQLQEPPPLMNREGRPLPAETIPILSTALAKAREDRYPNVAAMGAALRAALAETRQREGEMTVALPAARVAEARPTPAVPPRPATAPAPSAPPRPAPASAPSRPAVAPTPRAAPPPRPAPQRPQRRAPPAEPDFDVELAARPAAARGADEFDEDLETPAPTPAPVPAATTPESASTPAPEPVRAKVADGTEFDEDLETPAPTLAPVPAAASDSAPLPASAPAAAPDSAPLPAPQPAPAAAGAGRGAEFEEDLEAEQLERTAKEAKSEPVAPGSKPGGSDFDVEY